MTFITYKLRYLILFAVLFLTACQKPMIEIEQGISDFSALGLIPIPAAIEEDEHGFPMYKDTYIKTICDKLLVNNIIEEYEVL